MPTYFGWPEGSDVVVTDDLGRRWNTRTRSEPWFLGGVPVVLIEGIAGGYLCSRMVPGNDPTLRHFRDRKAPTPAGGGSDTQPKGDDRG